MTPLFNSPQLVAEAMERIQPYVRQTILEPSTYYSQRTGADVYFKCENLQHTGSFKVRGALSKILSLNEEELARGIVTASTGNHGSACAFAMQQVGASGIVFVPETAAETKLAAIRRQGAEIRTFGMDSIETEKHSRDFAAAHGMTYVPPYNDPLIVAGQGTIGLELLQKCQILTLYYLCGRRGIDRRNRFLSKVYQAKHPGIRLFSRKFTGDGQVGAGW